MSRIVATGPGWAKLRKYPLVVLRAGWLKKLGTVTVMVAYLVAAVGFRCGLLPSNNNAVGQSPGKVSGSTSFVEQITNNVLPGVKSASCCLSTKTEALPSCCCAKPSGGATKSKCCQLPEQKQAAKGSPSSNDEIAVWTACSCDGKPISLVLASSDPRLPTEPAILPRAGNEDQSRQISSLHMPRICLLPETPPPELRVL